MKLHVAIAETHAAETDLIVALTDLGEQHADEHDVRHITGMLAAWSREHLSGLAAEGKRYSLQLPSQPTRRPGLIHRLQKGGADGDAGLRLLHDVRNTHLVATAASTSWTILEQGAKATNDAALLALVQRSQPRTIRTAEWTMQKLKEASPQILSS